MASTDEARVKVLGNGIQLHQLNSDYSCFRTAVQPSWYPPRLTMREVAMLRIMDALTDKPDWHRKVNDAHIVAKWRNEALEQTPVMSSQAFDWCIFELRDKAKAFERTGLIRTFDSHSACVKSDLVLTSDLLTNLKDAVKPLLEREPKDWHPRSNDQVLNLVHPSLYPLVYGRTRYLAQGSVDLDNWFKSDTGICFPDQTRPEPPPNRYDADPAEMYSFRFQWLPCDVGFKGDAGTDVVIRSYINNLEPTKNRRLYALIEQAISLSIEPWNQVLVRATTNQAPLRIQCEGGADWQPAEPPSWIEEIPYDTNDEDLAPELVARLNEFFGEPDNPELVEIQGPFSLQDSLHETSSLVWSAHEKFNRTRRILHPEPGDEDDYRHWRSRVDGSEQLDLGERWNAPDPERHVRLEHEYRDRGLQVIVKLASIELTPEQPKYAGGSWHVEGMMNEHIVATSILYYDVENVSEARISLRQNADLDEVDMPYEQDDHAPLCVIFGTSSLREEIKLQELGSIATRRGRLLAFPNTLQHRVEPFELIDKSKPGHRRFLVLWLVDPNYPLPSTSIVPPQQESWWLERSAQDVHPALNDRALMTFDEAKAIRLQLMDERTQREQATANATDTYNFCEH